MFDIGWPELMLIMVVALVVIGPKDLPAAIRTVTTILRKVRGMAAEFQNGLADIAREAGVDDIKNNIEDIVSYDPKDALDNIAEIDGGEFSFDDDGNPTSGNSILDPEIQSRMFDDDPDAAAADTPEPVVEPKSEPATPADGDASTATNEDEPALRPAAPATAPASGNS